MTEPLLTESALAELLGVSARTIRAWLSDRALPCYRIGRTVRFRASEIERWLRQFHQGRAAAIASRPSSELDSPAADTVA